MLIESEVLTISRPKAYSTYRNIATDKHRTTATVNMHRIFGSWAMWFLRYAIRRT